MQPPQRPLNEDEKKEMQRRIHRSAAFQRVFRGPDGELVLKEIMKFAGMKDDSFDPDPYVHANKAGRRAVGIFIQNAMDADCELALKELDKNAKATQGRKTE